MAWARRDGRPIVCPQPQSHSQCQSREGAVEQAGGAERSFAATMRLSTTLLVLALVSCVENCLVAGSSINDRFIAEAESKSNNLAFSADGVSSATALSFGDFAFFAPPEGLMVIGKGGSGSNAGAGSDGDFAVIDGGADVEFAAGDSKVVLNGGAGFGGSSKGPNKAARAGQFVSLRGESPSSFTGLLFGSGVAEIIATTSEANGAEEAVLAGEILTDLNLKKSIQDFTIG